MDQYIARLLIYPTEQDYCPENLDIIRRSLLQHQFIGEQLSEFEDERYLVGDAFLSHVSFLGCSPAIEFEPQSEGDEQFCHVKLSLSDALTFYSGKNNVQVNCPHCKSSISDWEAMIENWQQDQGYQHACPQCGESLQPTALNWRKTAMFSHVAIELWNIYPHEAVPTDGILTHLERATGVRWKYCYTR